MTIYQLIGGGRIFEHDHVAWRNCRLEETTSRYDRPGPFCQGHARLLSTFDGLVKGTK